MPKYVKHLQLFNAEGETLYHQQSSHEVQDLENNDNIWLRHGHGTYDGNNLIVWMRRVGHL